MFCDLPDALIQDNNEEAVARGVLLPSQLEMDLWRKKGAPGKCHNFSHLITGSPQLVQKWLKIAPQMIPRDNATRWGSFKVMIATFLKLKWSYEKWWQKYPKEFTEEERLTNRDWEQLEKIDFFMTALDDATKFLEGPRATLERMIPTMEFILDHFEQGKVCSN